MKKYLILGLTLCISALVFGQKIPAAKWGNTISKTVVNVGDVVEVILKPMYPKDIIFTLMIMETVHLKKQNLVGIKMRHIHFWVRRNRWVLIIIRMMFLIAR